MQRVSASLSRKLGKSASGRRFASTLHNYPVAQLTKLSNGVRVVTQPSNNEQVAVSVNFNTGSRFEDAKTQGSAITLASAAENAGVSTKSGAEIQEFFGVSPKDQTSSLLKKLADVTAAPKVDAALIESRRQWRAQHEKNIYAGQVNTDVILDRLKASAFRTTALGYEYGSVAQNLTPADVEAFHKKQFIGSNLVVSATGAVEHDKLVADVEKAFGSLAAGQKSTVEPAGFIGSDFRYREDSMDQVQLAIAFATCGINHPDYFTLKVFGEMIGHYKSSEYTIADNHTRLTYEIAAEDFAYETKPISASFSDIGLFGVYMRAEPEGLANATYALCKGLTYMANNVDELDLNMAKKRAKRVLAAELEKSQVLASKLGQQVTFSGRPISAAEAEALIDTIDTKHMAEVAQRYFVDVDHVLAGYGNIHELPDYVILRRKSYFLRY